MAIEHPPSADEPFAPQPDLPGSYRIADETWVIPQLVTAPFVGNVYVNSMVIRGPEPILVDTGMPARRAEFLRQVWSIVDPADVRWVFLSHDDGDHAGNLMEVLDACPNATLVTTWFSLGRLEVSAERTPPIQRCIWVNDEETFAAGDRTLVAVRPPLYDNPTTRGLFDPKTGVYWSVDSFGLFLPHEAQDAADLAPADWREGFFALNRVNHPWHVWIHDAKWGTHVDRVQRLGARTIATCHGPTIHGTMVDEAFGMMREIPAMGPWSVPTQTDLEALLASLEGEPDR